MTQLGSLIEPIGGPGAAPPEDAHEPVRAPVSRPPNDLRFCCQALRRPARSLCWKIPRAGRRV